MPAPLRIDDVKVPECLLDLVELLARHNHDVWAEQRIREGWTYGDYRDDNKKTHPCLRHYDDLPETEKDYDRNTAVAIVKLLIKLGFQLEK